MTKPTKRRKPSRVVDGLKAAVSYAKGDKTKGKLSRFRVKNGAALRIVK
jgi:hypothetical protein